MTMGRKLLSYGAVALAACCMSLSYILFVFPNSFAPAGINGLATMIQYLFHFSIGYMSLLINLPLILLSWKALNPDFARKSLLYVVTFSLATLALQNTDLSALAYSGGSSAILGPAAAGVISGAVTGVVIQQNGSTGGTDIVAAWISKTHPGVSLVWAIFCLNAAVALLSFFVYNCQFEPVILCLIYCYLSSSISSGILRGGQTALKFEVITRHADTLSAQLMQELHRGVTVIPARGMYSDTPYDLLICIVNRHQIVQFKRILAQFPETFTYVSSVNEVLGNFKKPAELK